MISGMATLVWSQASRTDLSTDILSVGALDLLATEGVKLAQTSERTTARR